MDGECSLGFSVSGDSCVPLRGSLLEHEFDSRTLEPGEEIDGLCQSWTLGNDTELWVSAVEMQNGGAYHHSNWLFTPEDQYPGPDGFWNCGDRSYSEIAATVTGGVLYAQGTQDNKDLQLFPEGVAVRIPPRSKIIGGTHLLNTSSTPVDTNMAMRLWTLDESEVSTPLAPLRLNYGGLELPPQASSEFSGECMFPWDADEPYAELYYVMPHYHYLGTHFRLDLVGGDRDGEVLFADEGDNSGATLPGIDLTGADGIRFTCGYDNPRDEVVGFGIGDQEMCVMLGFMHSEWTFDGNVKSAEFLDTKGGVHRYGGECSVIGVRFSQEK